MKHKHYHTHKYIHIAYFHLFNRKKLLCARVRRKETDQEDEKTQDGKKNGGKRGMKHEKQRQTGMNEILNKQGNEK